MSSRRLEPHCELFCCWNVLLQVDELVLIERCQSPDVIYALTSLFFSPEGRRSAAAAWRRSKRTGQVLANAAARGCCQPRHSMCRGAADPTEQPEHGRSHRQDGSAPRCSERVPGGEAWRGVAWHRASSRRITGITAASFPT